MGGRRTTWRVKEVNEVDAAGVMDALRDASSSSAHAGPLCDIGGRGVQPSFRTAALAVSPRDAGPSIPFPTGRLNRRPLCSSPSCITLSHTHTHACILYVSWFVSTCVCVSLRVCRKRLSLTVKVSRVTPGAAARSSGPSGRKQYIGLPCLVT